MAMVTTKSIAKSLHFLRSVSRTSSSCRLHFSPSDLAASHSPALDLSDSSAATITSPPLKSQVMWTEVSHRIMKGGVYEHVCGGEDAEEVSGTRRDLSKKGFRGISDYGLRDAAEGCERNLGEFLMKATLPPSSGVYGTMPAYLKNANERRGILTAYKFEGDACLAQGLHARGFKTCRLLLGNPQKKELTIIQRRILRRLRSKKVSLQRNLYSKINTFSYIKLQTTRKLSLFYEDLLKTEMHRGRERASYIPCLLNLEKRLDVILVRLLFCDTLPQARQLISHGKVCVNNGVVSITRMKVPHTKQISFREDDLKIRLAERRRSFYMEYLGSKLIGKSVPARGWRRTKMEWFRLLKTERGCRLLLKSRFLKQLCSRSSMQEEDKFGLEKALGTAHDRIKRNLYYFKSLFLLQKRKERTPEWLANNFSLYSESTYNTGSPHQFQRKSRIRKIELPTHYLEANYKTLKAVVFYGPDIGHVAKPSWQLL